MLKISERRGLVFTRRSFTLGLLIFVFAVIAGGIIHLHQTAAASDLVVTGISPIKGPTSGGQQVTINGEFEVQGHWVVQIAAGQQHACALANTGKVYCWGGNWGGMLGDGTTDNRNLPVQVDDSGVLAGKKFVQISAGEGFTCGIDDEGKAYCWGWAGNAQLGDGTEDNVALPPVAVDTSGVLAGKKLVQISAGAYHVCVLDTKGKAYCWGWGQSGELGDGGTSNYSVAQPVAVDTSGVLNGKELVQISATSSGAQTCALSSEGKVYCWGQNGSGQLGDGTVNDGYSPVAVDISGALQGKTLKYVATGSQLSCAIDQENDVYCWGNSYYGRLGVGTQWMMSTTPMAVDTTGALSGKVLTSLSLGANHLCVVEDKGLAYCWGYNGYGQLGAGGYFDSEIPLRVDSARVAEGNGFLHVAVGNDNTCGLGVNLEVYCWGATWNSMLGGKVIIDNHFPLAVDTSGALDGKVITQIATGFESSHSCALASDNSIYCWGENDSGQLGDGTTTYRTSPVKVDTSGVLNGKVIKQIATGHRFTCVLDTASQIYCWGYNGFGQYGIGSHDQSVVPVLAGTTGPVAGKTLVQIVAGAFEMCALDDTGKVYCWGYGYYGQLGDGTSTYNSTTSVEVDMSGALNGKTVTQLTGAIFSFCALASDSQVYCWGWNSSGQLGDGTNVNRNVPTAVDTTGVLAGKTITRVESEIYHSCALDDGGKVYCWGEGGSGQLGDGQGTFSLVPVAVDTSGALLGKTITELTVGENHTCVIDSEGVGYCWGSNGNGQLGNGMWENGLSPVAIDTSGVLAGKALSIIESGYLFTCAVDSEGKIYCWGQNNSGGLGVGTEGDFTAHARVATVEDGPINFWGELFTSEMPSRYELPIRVWFDIEGDKAECLNVVVAAGGKSLTCTTSAHGAGLVSVSVDDGVNIKTLENAYTYVDVVGLPNTGFLTSIITQSMLRSGFMLWFIAGISIVATGGMIIWKGRG